METLGIGPPDSPLLAVNLQSGRSTFRTSSKVVEDTLVLRETQRVGLFVRPLSPEAEARIFIGDLPVDQLFDSPAGEGHQLGGARVWFEQTYFESARGLTEVTLRYRDGGEWLVGGRCMVFVVPTKLSDEAYSSMEAELETLGPGLVLDLLGKSTRTYDLRYAAHPRHFASRDQELALLQSTLDRISGPLDEMLRRPATRTRGIRTITSYRGRGRLTPSDAAALARRGVPPSMTSSPISLARELKAETFDLPEHRLIKAFLLLIERRAADIFESAREHAAAIERDRPYRSIKLGDGETLFDLHDRPRIERLHSRAQQAARTSQAAGALARTGYLSELTPRLDWVPDVSFQRGRHYQAVLGHIRRFLHTNSAWQGASGEEAVAKLTSKLFEQWVFLRLVESLREMGLELDSWQGLMTGQEGSRFLPDIERGTSFEGWLSSETRLRISYEPWILPREAALAAGRSLCRAEAHRVPWSPDIVIECLEREGDGDRVRYAVVIDCKYAQDIRESHWRDVGKYLQIRDTVGNRQVARQLWLALPGVGAILPEDAAVTFGEDGPNCRADETVRFVLRADPVAKRPDAISTFAEGTLRFLRRVVAQGMGGE